MASDPNNPNPEIPTIPALKIPIPAIVPELNATETEISITVTEIPPSEIPGILDLAVSKKFEAGSSSKSVKLEVQENKKKHKKIKGDSLMGILCKMIGDCGVSKQEHSDENDEQVEGDNVRVEGNLQNEEASDDENDPHNTEEDDNPNDSWGIESSSMRVLVYVNNNMKIALKNVLNTLNIFPGDYTDWNALARATLLFWRMVNPDMPTFPVLEHATPTNCWPGSVTIFGKITCVGQDASFQRLNWSENEFENVRANINCLIVIQI